MICGVQLSKSFNIIRGTKTGDPLSALLFIMVIDRVCKPKVATAISCMAIQNERMVNPIPLQAFADDIVVVQYNSEISQLIFDAGEEIMAQAGLEVKPEKGAVLYTRRSGNNWYKGKSDIKPKVKVQSHELAVCGRNKPYKYLGKSLSLSMKCNQGQNQTLIVKRQSCTSVTIMHFSIMHFPSLFLPIMHFVIMHFAIMHFPIVHFPIMHFPIVHFEFNPFFIHALIKIIVYLKDILALFNHTLSNLTVLSNLTPSATIMQNSEITQPLSET